MHAHRCLTCGTTYPCDSAPPCEEVCRDCLNPVTDYAIGYVVDCSY